ncbi:MAG: sigma-70 family RNA polymerase sigma factor [Planctomycetes bacterium]|nr:sigma-70 family RNA polymerase sigma factor [Planctomycetota bacterium]
MPTHDPTRFTELLQRHRRGDAIPLSSLLPFVYDELRELARQQLRREAAAPLEPTALVHEVYLRMVDQQTVEVADRVHFRRLCARVMRQVLVDLARRRDAQKRDASREVTLPTWLEATAGAAPPSILALDETLQRLAALDDRKAQVVEMRCFGGLTMPEVADALGVSLRTVEADWFFARAWLKAELRGGRDE